MDGGIHMLNQTQPVRGRGKNRTKLINAMCERMPLGEAAKLVSEVKQSFVHIVKYNCSYY